MDYGSPGLTYSWPAQYYLYADPVVLASSPWPAAYRLNGGIALKQYLDAMASETLPAVARPSPTVPKQPTKVGAVDTP